MTLSLPATKRRSIKRPPHQTIDSDGALIVVVPLSNGDLKATLLKADFDELVDLGFTTNWNASPAKQVRLRHHTKATLSVARLITGARAGQRVKYHDFNPLNLKLTNLRLAKGLGSDDEVNAHFWAAKCRQERHQREAKYAHLDPKDRFWVEMSDHLEDESGLTAPDRANPRHSRQWD